MLNVSGVIKELQYKIAQHEDYKTEANVEDAKAFFKQVLANDLVFKRADGTQISKMEFINGIKLPNEFVSREIQNIVIPDLDDTKIAALVSLIVVGKKEDGEKELEPHYYENIRLFKRSADGWQLHAWYNTEIGKDQTRQLTTTKLVTVENPKEKTEDLRMLYPQVCSSWRQLVDVRFKLLGLLPAVSLATIISLLNSDGMTKASKAFVCFIGLIFTVALRVYDLRNTQLHNDLVSRGRKIEEELGIIHGQFLGRLKPNKKLLGFIKIEHDTALAWVYNTVMFIWLVMMLIWLVVGI